MLALSKLERLLPLVLLPIRLPWPVSVGTVEGTCHLPILLKRSAPEVEIGPSKQGGGWHAASSWPTNWSRLLEPLGVPFLHLPGRPHNFREQNVVYRYIDLTNLLADLVLHPSYDAGAYCLGDLRNRPAVLHIYREGDRHPFFAHHRRDAPRVAISAHAV